MPSSRPVSAVSASDGSATSQREDSQMQWGQMRRALPILAARWRREEGEPVSPRSGREQVKAQRPIAGSDWRRMPPIDLAIRSRPVLTGGPLLRPPRVSGTRSLLTREPGDRAAGPGRPDLAVSRAARPDHRDRSATARERDRRCQVRRAGTQQRAARTAGAAGAAGTAVPSPAAPGRSHDRGPSPEPDRGDR